MKSKEGLEFGTEVSIFDELAEVFDLCPNNSQVIKVRMLEGRFPGIVVIAVLNKVKLASR